MMQGRSSVFVSGRGELVSISRVSEELLVIDCAATEATAASTPTKTEESLMSALGSEAP